MISFRALFLAAAVLSVATTTQAADLVIEQDVPDLVDDSSRWDGLFIGVFGGYADATLDPSADGADDVGMKGWFIGIDGGVNFALDNSLVVGLVGDLALADAEYFVSLAPLSATVTVDALASLRGRVGFDAGGFLPYLTAGLAYAHVSGEGRTDGVLNAAGTADYLGYTVGAGVEIAVTEDLSIDLLYRYSKFGEQETFDMTSGPDSAFADNGPLTKHTVSVGLNWAL